MQDIKFHQSNDRRTVVYSQGRVIGFIWRDAEGKWFAGGEALYGALSERCKTDFFVNRAADYPSAAKASYDEVVAAVKEVETC